MKIEKDFGKLLRLFNKNQVKYCIIGAFAVALYAKPRYTKDMDILVESSRGNAFRIIRALDEFGFKSLGLRERDFSVAGKIVQLGYEPIRVDIVTSISGVDFEKVWRNKTASFYGKEKVFFIGLNELINAKKASGRKDDLVDIELLEQVKMQKKKERRRKRFP